MSSSNSPCAACKFLRQKCGQECVCAPYFPPDNPQKFVNVHQVFGRSNVAKLLNEVNASQREDAVNSLAYEAEARLQDPVCGCVGYASYFTTVRFFFQNASSSAVMQHNMMPMMGIPTAAVDSVPQQQQQIFETEQQLAAVEAAREQQEMFQSYEQQHEGQQQEIVRFNQITSTAATMSPSLALGSFDNPYQIQTQQQDDHGGHPLQAQVLLQPQGQQHQQQNHQQQTQQNQQQQQQKQRSGSEEGRSIGPC
ncbi:hypothetical protein CRYUN_Cryun17cG0126500 [Craigia yunnanensis]